MTDIKNVTYKVYTSFEDLNNTREEWDDFVLNTSADIFLTFDWCKIWWQYYGKGRDLRIYIFKSNNNIVGILPIFFEKIWLFFISIRTGKMVGSDFTLAQFSLPIYEEYYDLCLQCLLEDLKTVKWHILRIGPLAGLSASAQVDMLENAFIKTTGSDENITTRDGMVHTYYKLQPTWENYHSSLKRKHRQEISHKYNLLERTFPGSILNLKTIIADETNVDAFYKDFVNMHQDYWKSLGKLGHFGDWPDAYKFHQTMTKMQSTRNRLRLIRVSLNNEVLGYEYAYKFGNKYFAILNARAQGGNYDKIGLGSIIFSEYAKVAISEKVTYIDSMRGKYDYKLKLGGELFTIKNVYITKISISNRLRINFFYKSAKLLNLLYYRIWFLRLAHKLPFRRSPLWKIWIRANL